MQETKKFPLVVDLDGTLTVSDTLMESVIRVVKHKPANLLRLPFWLASGRAVFKAKIAEHADFRAEMLPYRESLSTTSSTNASVVARSSSQLPRIVRLLSE
ncbi:hypothetical protein [Burkholderia vietnamiensis]|uniref:hypothetical protein n=1 Tax=Burkholderia vietnamiensis TaxID=60552 RepID=UPI002653EE0B|nr:hypothetical protein [Burkholderia vietnamiensis]MDN7816494.1 hypothetical protein [Burkholderia vietnamiensis]